MISIECAILYVICEDEWTGTLLLAFIDGAGEPSFTMRAFFDHTGASAVIKDLHCVCERLRAESRACNSFVNCNPTDKISTMFVIDARGHLEATFVGYVLPEKLVDQLAQFLDKIEPPEPRAATLPETQDIEPSTIALHQLKAELRCSSLQLAPRKEPIESKEQGVVRRNVDRRLKEHTTGWSEAKIRTSTSAWAATRGMADDEAVVGLDNKHLESIGQAHTELFRSYVSFVDSDNKQPAATVGQQRNSDANDATLPAFPPQDTEVKIQDYDGVDKVKDTEEVKTPQVENCDQRQSTDHGRQSEERPRLVPVDEMQGLSLEELKSALDDVLQDLDIQTKFATLAQGFADKLLSASDVDNTEFKFVDTSAEASKSRKPVVRKGDLGAKSKPSRCRSCGRDEPKARHVEGSPKVAAREIPSPGGPPPAAVAPKCSTSKARRDSCPSTSKRPVDTRGATVAPQEHERRRKEAESRNQAGDARKMNASKSPAGDINKVLRKPKPTVADKTVRKIPEAPQKPEEEQSPDVPGTSPMPAAFEQRGAEFTKAVPTQATIVAMKPICNVAPRCTPDEDKAFQTPTEDKAHTTGWSEANIQTSTSALAARRDDEGVGGLDNKHLESIGQAHTELSSSYVTFEDTENKQPAATVGQQRNSDANDAALPAFPPQDTEVKIQDYDGVGKVTDTEEVKTPQVENCDQIQSTDQRRQSEERPGLVPLDEIQGLALEEHTPVYTPVHSPTQDRPCTPVRNFDKSQATTMGERKRSREFRTPVNSQLTKVARQEKRVVRYQGYEVSDGDDQTIFEEFEGPQCAVPEKIDVPEWWEPVALAASRRALDNTDESQKSGPNISTKPPRKVCVATGVRRPSAVTDVAMVDMPKKKSVQRFSISGTAFQNGGGTAAAIIPMALSTKVGGIATSSTTLSRCSELVTLYFCFPGGKSVSRKFRCDSYLHEVRWCAEEEVLARDLPSCFPITLARRSPLLEFLREDYRKTLRDLDLVQTTSLLILPRAAIQNSAGLRSQQSLQADANWTMLCRLAYAVFIATPLAFIWGLLTRHWSTDFPARRSRRRNTSLTGGN